MKRFFLVIGALAFAAGCSGSNSNSSSSGSTGAGTTGHATTSSTTGAGTTTGTNSGTTTGSTTGGTTTGGSGSSGGSTGSSGSGGSTGSVTCTEITADPSGWGYTGDPNYPYFTTTIAPNIGDSAPDGLSVQLFDLNGGNFTQTGNFDLGSGDNANYSSCPECVLVYEGAADGGTGRTFFQSRGTLDITAADTGTGVLQGTLTDTTLVEVTIDANSYTSTPVAGGACLHLASATIDVSPTTSSSSGSGSTGSTSGSGSGSTSTSTSSGSGSGSTSSGSGSGSTSSGSGSGSGSTSSGSGSGSGSTSSGSGSGSTTA